MHTDKKATNVIGILIVRILASANQITRVAIVAGDVAFDKVLRPQISFKLIHIKTGDENRSIQMPDFFVLYPANI